MGIVQVWTDSSRIDNRVTTSAVPFKVAKNFQFYLNRSSKGVFEVLNVPYEATSHALGKLLIGDCAYRGLSM
jgi:hypothetical protein